MGKKQEASKKDKMHDKMHSEGSKKDKMGDKKMPAFAKGKPKGKGC